MVSRSKQCSFCGGEYFQKPSESITVFEQRKYCSFKCHRDDMKKNNSYPHSNHKHSEDSKEKMRLAKLGKTQSVELINKRIQKDENHYNWKGGISKHYKNGYYSAEYKAWRKAVFIRDNFTCQGCGKMGYITAHHIKSFAHYPELKYDIDNGQTLCEDCHSKTDNYKSKIKK